MTAEEAAVIKAATDLVDTHRHAGTWADIYSDLVAAVDALRGRAQTTHPFHMSSYSANNGPRCWCGKFGDDPIHQTTTPTAAGEVSSPPLSAGRYETPEKLAPADHIGIFDGPPLAVECRYYRGTCDDHPECQPDYYTGDPE